MSSPASSATKPTLRTKLAALLRIPYRGVGWAFLCVGAAFLTAYLLGAPSLTRLSHGDPRVNPLKSVQAPSNLWNTLDEKHLFIAFVFASLIILAACFVCLLTLPIYLLSKDTERQKRAGGVFKTAFTFLLTSGAGVFGFLQFTQAD
jgi:hypothetical protein